MQDCGIKTGPNSAGVRDTEHGAGKGIFPDEHQFRSLPLKRGLNLRSLMLIVDNIFFKFEKNNN
jgi:hypothetical protein